MYRWKHSTSNREREDFLLVSQEDLDRFRHLSYKWWARKYKDKLFLMVPGGLSAWLTCRVLS